MLFLLMMRMRVFLLLHFVRLLEGEEREMQMMQAGRRRPLEFFPALLSALPYIQIQGQRTTPLIGSFPMVVTPLGESRPMGEEKGGLGHNQVSTRTALSHQLRLLPLAQGLYVDYRVEKIRPIVRGRLKVDFHCRR